MLAQTQAQTARQWVDQSPHHVQHVRVAPHVQLEVLDWGGKGPVLVFLAGLGMSAHIYDDFAPRFRDRFHVYAVTRRGFGTSSEPSDGYDAVTRAHDIVTVLDSLRIGRAVLVGHSIAGDELSKVGATSPARVAALVYLDAYDYGPARVAALDANPPPTALTPSMTAVDSASPAAVAAFFGRTVADGARFPEAQVRTDWVSGSDGRLRRHNRVDATSRTLEGTETSDFRKITAPALGLFVTYPGGASAAFRSLGYARADGATRARADRYFGQFESWLRAGRERFRTELAHATVIEFPGAGHNIFLTQPDHVEREIRAFLAKALRSAR
jgi:pimeloyl-ACP methyl ester carboxylesterase